MGHGAAHEVGHHEGDHADLSGEGHGPAVGAGGEGSQVSPWGAAWGLWGGERGDLEALAGDLGDLVGGLAGGLGNALGGLDEAYAGPVGAGDGLGIGHEGASCGEVHPEPPPHGVSEGDCSRPIALAAVVLGDWRIGGSWTLRHWRSWGGSMSCCCCYCCCCYCCCYCLDLLSWWSAVDFYLDQPG